MSLLGEVVHIPLLVLWKEHYSMQGHFPAFSRILSVSAKGAKAYCFSS